nr:NAD(P)H-dependent oxidoreductase subunit E [uncultured Blautia sp.]
MIRKRTESFMDREENINEILAYYSSRKDKKEQEMIVAMLRELQEICGGISPALQERAASAAGVKKSVVQYLVRMYTGLKETPYEHTVTVCTGKRCRDKGGAAVLQAVRNELGIKKEGISADGNVYLNVRGCLRNCGKSPNLLIDGKMFSGVKPDQIGEIFKKCF